MKVSGKTFELIRLDGKYQVVNVSPVLKQVILEVPRGSVSKSLDVILDKEGSSVEILGVYAGLSSEKIDLTVNVIHKAFNTKSLTQIRGVLKDSSSSLFKGVIKIEKKAQKTDSYLDHDVLILGDKARNESQPMLEIEADDVKATHGATTGRISEEEIFYLMSRGLSREEAVKIILEGFFEAVFGKITDGKIREEIKSIILERLSKYG